MIRQTVLLFYENFELDRFVAGDRHLQRWLRKGHHLFKRGHKTSGFRVAFELLKLGLERAGCSVRVNDYAYARQRPGHPVGICGYPHILRSWSLPNPAILGPGLFDHPEQAPELMSDPRFHWYVVQCEWMNELFAQCYGNQCLRWFAGIDTDRWTDASAHEKELDLIVYDKIRHVPEVRGPVLAAVEKKGLTYVHLRYGHYEQKRFRTLLDRARGMLFLSESETQGLAYQQAMACNVPVLAWDNGFWLDPIRLRYQSEIVPASSVPYFSAECGERFRSASEFPETLDLFWSRLSGYRPRTYVRRELSFERSAELYLETYCHLVGSPHVERVRAGR